VRLLLRRSEAEGDSSPGRTRAGTRRVLAAAAGLLLLASCGRAPRDPVRETLERTLKAAEARDAGAVIDHLSADFRDGEGEGRAEAADTIRRYLAGYQSISLKVSDEEVERGPEEARAMFRVAMSGKPRAIGGLEGFLPRESRWRFELRLKPEKDGWKITWASWSRLGEGD